MTIYLIGKCCFLCIFTSTHTIYYNLNLALKIKVLKRMKFIIFYFCCKENYSFHYTFLLLFCPPYTNKMISTTVKYVTHCIIYMWFVYNDTLFIFYKCFLRRAAHTNKKKILKNTYSYKILVVWKIDQFACFIISFWPLSGERQKRVHLSFHTHFLYDCYRVIIYNCLDLNYSSESDCNCFVIKTF